jgi:glucose/arabinose dehydrogenase
VSAARPVLAALVALLAGAAPAAAAPSLVRVGTFAEPVQVAGAAGSPTVVVERRGLVRRLRDRRVVLDLRRRVLIRRAAETADQRGLLGVAWSPRDARTLLALYVDRRDRVVVDAFGVSTGARRRVLDVGEAGPFHHGGQLRFAPDGALWVGTGYSDVEPRSQDPASLQGKLLRVVLPDGPAAAPQVEVVASGLRNPWRFAFDERTGDVWIGDVGGDAVEEVDVLAGGLRGATANFGWPAWEGSARRPDWPDIPGHVAPVVEHRHRDGWCSIVGGVWRPRLGFLYGDLCRGWVHAARRGADGVVRSRRLRLRVPALVSFGEDGAGRAYVVSFAGAVYRLREER